MNPTAETPLRGVFKADDAWVATGDLFRRDSDGDYWLLDTIATLIRTAHGPVAPTPVRDALWSLEAVDIAVCYGVQDPDGTQSLVVGAVSLRDGHELDAQDLTDALAHLPKGDRPHYVRVAKEIPVTTWYRPVSSGLASEGVPKPGRKLPVFELSEEGNYKEMGKAKAHA